MRPAKASLLLHPVFVLSLFLLLANDLSWKYEYHNWLTGKLSDVAGMVVLPVFLLAVFPNCSRKVRLLSCAAFFVWWKSPLSQPVIDELNTAFHLPVHRVVDPGDLLALVVLPFALIMKPVSFTRHSIAFHSLRWALGLITVVSLCSTSMPYRSLFMAHPDSREIYFGESWTQKQPATAILQSLRAKGITYRLDSVMYYPVLNQQNLYYRLKTTTDSAGSWQRVSQQADSTLYLKREGRPYYLIPEYKTHGDEQNRSFRNIRFTLAENSKGTKTRITVEMFEAPGLRPYDIMDRATKKAFKNIFEKLFSGE